MTTDKTVLIANGQGFWGDSLLGPKRLVEEGPLDYLTLDYLAEVTMSIMQKQKLRNPELGYATDFVSMLKEILPTCQKKGIKVIANAGGVNPRGCLEAIKGVINELGLSGIKIGIVEGDDILDQVPELMASGEQFKNLDNGDAVEGILDRMSSANVYIGAKPIADALDQGADIVVTGRATDPSVVLAPLIHEFGWSMADFDKLAAGTVMGHILECGAQCTGGNYCDWKNVPDFARIGYPVVEAKADGTFTVTKHDGTGGLVNVDTITSQLMYELGDPKGYLGPDCTSDFTTIQLKQDGENRVKVSGIKGSAPTPTYKVSMSYENGYKIVGQLTYTGPDAIEKAELAAEILFDRVALYGTPIPEADRFVELFGTNVCYKGIVKQNEPPAEVLLRVGAKSQDKELLNLLGREIAPLITSGPVGVTGFAGGRPRPSEIVGYWPALIDKTKVSTTVTVEEV
ncbi:MAG: acyclic terpene utilization AtuA family protein [Spongiibacteraceae bacterium]